MVIKRGINRLLFLTGMLAVSAFAQQSETNSTTYSIDSDNSILRVYVGRAGPLARMGHNHFVHTNGLIGEINLASDPVNSTATFAFPVSSFFVDDQAERDRAASEEREGFDTATNRCSLTTSKQTKMKP